MVRLHADPVIRFLKSEDGPTAVEYAVMLALIILVVFGVVQTLGGTTNSTFANAELSKSLSGAAS